MKTFIMVIFSLIFAGSAQALPVRYDFTGVYHDLVDPNQTSNPDWVPSPIVDGAAVTGWLEFDKDLASLEYSDSTSKFYLGGASYNFTIGTASIFASHLDIGFLFKGPTGDTPYRLTDPGPSLSVSNLTDYAYLDDLILDFTPTGGILNLISDSSDYNTYYSGYANLEFASASVPEPSSLVLLFVGLFAVFATAKRSLR